MGDWSDWVGRTTVADATLDPAQARRMQATLDREPSAAAGDALPPAWHWLYFHEVARASDLGHDGHTRLGVWMPPFPLPRRMWAGGVLEWHHPVLLGHEAQRRSTITAIDEKQGRSGALIFTTVTHEVHQAGRLCISEEQHIVYREAAASSAATQAPAADSASDASRMWSFDATALFRYSALTFNGHRIHYDPDYTRDVEGYAGLVVHGPLLATLMLDLAHGEGRSMARFEYRAVSPVTLPHGLTVRAAFDGAATRLWVAHEDGSLAMQGTLA